MDSIISLQKFRFLVSFFPPATAFVNSYQNVFVNIVRHGSICYSRSVFSSTQSTSGSSLNDPFACGGRYNSVSLNDYASSPEWLTAFIVALIYPRQLINRENNYRAWDFLLYTIANLRDITVAIRYFFCMILLKPLSEVSNVNDRLRLLEIERRSPFL